KEGERYKLGMKFLHVGQSARSRNKLYKIAGRKVHELVVSTGDGVDFSVPEHGRVMTLYNEVEHPNDPIFELGKPFYMHNSAAGKAVLAEFSENCISGILDQWGLPKTTEHTITDREELFRTLEKIRDRGFAYNDEEFREGVRGVGKVVQNPD